MAKRNKTAGNRAGSMKAKKHQKKTSKLPGFFSLSNQKFVVLFALVVASVGFGSYKLYTSQAATDGKTTFPTVAQCLYFKPYLYHNVPNQRACTKTVQQFLNVYKFHRGHGGPYLTVDGLYGSNTREAVAAYQVKIGRTGTGTVNNITWAAIDASCASGKNAGGSIATSYRNVRG